MPKTLETGAIRLLSAQLDKHGKVVWALFVQNNKKYEIIVVDGKTIERVI
jgi:hypothetical protein